MTRTDSRSSQLCPRCGDLMKLTRVEPYRDPVRAALVSIFDCDCGYRLSETFEREAALKRSA
jgi:C4-type Zn-finger protein